MTLPRLYKCSLSVLALFSLVGCLNFKDPESTKASYDIRDSCQASSLKSYPPLQKKIKKSEPVYETVVVGDPICTTKTVRKPHVVVGQGMKMFKDVTTCKNQTERRYVSTNVWTEVIDTNAVNRNKNFKICVNIECKDQFGKDANKCVRAAKL